MKTNIFKNLQVGISSYLILGLVFSAGLPIANATALTFSSDTMSRLKAAEDSNHTIEFTAHAAVVDTHKVIITFPAGFLGSSLLYTDVDFNIDASPEGDGACNGVDQTLVDDATPAANEWDARFSNTAENLTLTLLSGGGTAVSTADDELCVKIGTNAAAGVNQYTNPSAGSYTISIGSGGTSGNTDIGSVTVRVIADDQVAVTASVAQAITFSISDNSIEFGPLTATDDTFADDSNGNANETEAHTLIVGTNATNGYTMTVQGDTLTATSGTIDAIGAANSASDPGTEQFGLRIDESGGAGVVSAPYAAAGFAYNATASTADEIAASATSSADTTYSVRYVANIASDTEAGAYSTTLTYIATANF